MHSGRYFRSAALFFACALLVRAAPPPPPRAIKIPAGSHLPMRLMYAVDSRSSSRPMPVYFQTAYPLAVEGRIVVPVGTFACGLLSARQPGRVRGRGKLIVRLTSLTFSTGYVVNLEAAPDGLEGGTRETLNAEGQVVGPSGYGRDALVVGEAAALGAEGGIASAIVGRSSHPGRNLLAGAGVGAAVGLAVVLLTRGPQAVLPRGAFLDFVFVRPLTLNPSRLPTAAVSPLPGLPAVPDPSATRRPNLGRRSPLPGWWRLWRP